MSEFNMLVTNLKGQETETIKALQGPSIMIVTGEKGTLKAGEKEHEVKKRICLHWV
jgi:mannose-6-phosphate isomerase